MKYTPGARRLSALHVERMKKLKPAQLTQVGFEKVQQEFETLTAERPAAVAELKKSREMGDLSENGYYKASRAKLSQIDGRLFHLQMMMKTAEIIEHQDTDFVTLGATVTVSVNGEKKIYMVVGKHEANPAQGRISDVSPIGRALLGKKVGETAVFHAPSGPVEYTIVKIGL